VVTEEDRRRAVEITGEVPGVSAVIDELRVRLD
jgi:osmotically-inducible protein OsmY